MLALRRFAPLAAAVAMAAAVAGCGSSSSGLPQDIPPANASGLISNLKAVQDDCSQQPSSARSAAVQYQRALDQLPDSVDPQVRKILDETGANLTKLAGSQAGCESGATGTSGLQGFQPTSTTATTTQDVTTPAPTTTATTTPKPQPPSEPQPAGNGEGSSGQGQSGQGEPSGGQPSGGQPSGGGSSGSGGGVTPGKGKQGARVGP